MAKIVFGMNLSLDGYVDEIAARTEPRFIEIKPEPRRKVRAIFIEIPSQRGCSRVPFTSGAHSHAADG